MKKLVFVLVGGLLLGSCGAEETGSEGGSNKNGDQTTVNESGDVVEDQITALVQDVEKGMKPLSPMADISNYDSQVKPYMVGEKETGNFNSKWEKGDYNISRFYSKKYNDDTQLGEVRLSISVNDDVVWDPETSEEDASKMIDVDKYKGLISDKLGSEPKAQEDYLGGGFIWKTNTANWTFLSYDDYSIELTVKEPK